MWESENRNMKSGKIWNLEFLKQNFESKEKNPWISNLTKTKSNIKK